MSGGDKITIHPCIRNRVYAHARGVGAAPVVEAADVLNVLEIPGADGGKARWE